MQRPTNTLEIARTAREMGIACIPCWPLTKVPSVPWKAFQAELPSEELIERWFADCRANIAAVCTARVIFDCDDASKAALVLAECGDTPHQLRTPRGGIHLGYRRRVGVAVRNTVRIKGQPIDIRTDGGLELIPSSRTADGRYEWLGPGLVPTSQLPVAKVGWTRDRTQRELRAITIDDPSATVRRARAYLATIEGAISGQRGHDRTFRVACILVQKFGLSIEQAFPLFWEWNQQCEPPWSEKELRHKLDDALRQKR